MKIALQNLNMYLTVTLIWNLTQRLINPDFVLVIRQKSKFVHISDQKLRLHSGKKYENE